MVQNLGECAPHGSHSCLSLHSFLSLVLSSELKGLEFLYGIRFLCILKYQN